MKLLVGLRKTCLGGLPLLVVAVCCQTTPREGQGPSGEVAADVVSVAAVGEPGAYRFEVGIRSPDTGCAQYADWWEVVGLEGRLIYRRVLGHSHVAEQPFVRGGGPVPVGTGEEVWVRAHMHPTGYGGAAYKGSVRGGFRAADLAAGFGADLAGQPPRPPECAN